MFDFEGQTAIVTGGTRGIGAAISRQFLRAGARVIALHRTDDASAQAFREENTAASERLEVRRLNVGDFDAVRSFFDEFESQGRELQILVNNAGIRRDAALALMSHADWQDVIDVNLGGCYSMCRFALKNLAPRRYGRIVNITSPSGRLGFPGQTNYAASKAGIVALTRSLAREVARRGVTANCVSPGFTDTDLIADLPETLLEEHRKAVPMQRFCDPDEVAHAVLFLATGEAGYISGAVLDVTGGL